jgi:hypothetical protein
MRQTKLFESLSIMLIISAVVLAAAALFLYAVAGTPKTSIVLALFSGLSFLASMIQPPHVPSLEIDKDGIYDPRLGIGKVFWKEVRDFYVQETEGNRFLCLQVNRPERFLMHADRSQKIRMSLHHSIGFRRINVDVGHLNLTVQDLHQRIENRLRQQPRSGA